MCNPLGDTHEHLCRFSQELRDSTAEKAHPLQHTSIHGMSEGGWYQVGTTHSMKNIHFFFFFLFLGVHVLHFLPDKWCLSVGVCLLAAQLSLACPRMPEPYEPYREQYYGSLQLKMPINSIVLFQ